MFRLIFGIRAKQHFENIVLLKLLFNQNTFNLFKDSLGAHNSRYSSKISLFDKRPPQNHQESSGKCVDMFNYYFTVNLCSNYGMQMAIM